MFDRLFTYPHTLARHRNGPLVNERRAYLAHLARAGMSRNTLRTTADHILIVADKLGLADRSGESISRKEILRWAALWATRSPGTLHRKGGPTSQFHMYAIRWLKFLGRLEQPPSPPGPFAEQILAFADYMHSEQGLSPAVSGVSLAVASELMIQQLSMNRQRLIAVFRGIFQIGYFAPGSFPVWPLAIRLPSLDGPIPLMGNL